MAGLILSALTAAAGTSFVLSHTQFGALMTGNTPGMSNQWQVFTTGWKVLFFFVSLPTVVLTALFVSFLAKKWPLVATVIAVLPISVVASGLRLRGMGTSFLLLVCAVTVASICGLARR